MSYKIILYYISVCYDLLYKFAKIYISLEVVITYIAWHFSTISFILQI
jgi:hypothetical protein